MTDLSSVLTTETTAKLETRVVEADIESYPYTNIQQDASHRTESPIKFKSESNFSSVPNVGRKDRSSSVKLDTNKVLLGDWRKAVEFLDKPCIRKEQIESLRAKLTSSETRLTNEISNFIKSENLEITKMVARNNKFVSNLANTNGKVIKEFMGLIRLSNDFISTLVDRYQHVSVDASHAFGMESKALLDQNERQFNFLFILAAAYAVILFCLMLTTTCVVNYQLKKLNSVQDARRHHDLVQSICGGRQQAIRASQTTESGSMEVSQL